LTAWEFTLDDTKGAEGALKIAVRTFFYKAELAIPPNQHRRLTWPFPIITNSIIFPVKSRLYLWR